ncbi:YchF/TatD family DNA exonuclease [bacterium]|nr:YchF/TatD family DNA exonuclease [bacterium]
MQIVDTHCHLDEEGFAHELDGVVAAAAGNGVAAMVTIGTSVQSSRRSIELAERFPGVVFAAVGIHPNYTADAKPGDWEIIEELARHPRVVAVGETGLDRYWDYAPIKLQQDYFDRHVALAEQANKPFIVHCRDADEETRKQLRDAAQSGRKLNGVMHSFCQSPESAAELLELGLFVSFTGMLTFKRNQELRDLAASLPVDRLFVETDAPYLAPMPNRGKRNEPAFVRYTLQCLAECHGVAPEEMARQTTANACGFFGIELFDR